MCRYIGLLILICGFPTMVLSQDRFEGLFHDFVIVQKESGEAKRERLRWITSERNRIHEELTNYSMELADMEKIVPRAVQPRDLPPSQLIERQRAQKNFNLWAENNNQQRRYAILRGTALNTLLQILGPIAHHRKIRTGDANVQGVFASLSAGNTIDSADAMHYHINPPTSAGSRVEMGLNKLPLQIVWPLVLEDRWPSDCDHLDRTRAAFIKVLSPAVDARTRMDYAEVFDKSLSLLQAKIQKEKTEVPNNHNFDAGKKILIVSDLERARRYLDSVRATVERLKNVPSDYRELRFRGGTIEDFLDFCYLHDIVFQESPPEDEAYYTHLYRLMQDYAHDVQFVEDWRNGINQQMRLLSDTDRELVWRASEQ